MAIIKEFEEKDYQVIGEAYEKLMASAGKRCKNEEELAVVKRAFEFANEAH